MRLVCLHNVVAGEPDEFDRRCSRVSAAEFRAFVLGLKERGALISFSELLRRLEEGRPAPDAVALSFDDGFLGVHRHALPVLREAGVDAAAFVNPLNLTGQRAPLFHFLEIELAFRHTERRAARLEFLDEPDVDLSTTGARVKAMKRVKRRLKTVPERERRAGHALLLRSLGVDPLDLELRARAEEKFQVMGLAEALALRDAGWTLGSHTLTHRTLGMLAEDELRWEIEGSKLLLGQVLGREDKVFAYPYGEPVHIGPLAPEICRAAGYRWAFTTVPGPVSAAAPACLQGRVDYADFAGARP